MLIYLLKTGVKTMFPNLKNHTPWLNQYLNNEFVQFFNRCMKIKILFLKTAKSHVLFNIRFLYSVHK